MFLDAQTLLSDAQAFSATGYSTNTFDTGAAGNEIATGEPLAALITVDTAADTASGNETYQFQIVQSANANLSSHDVLVETDTTFLTGALLTAGAKVVIPIPPGLKTKRYLGLRAVLGGTTPTITITAAFLPLSLIEVRKDYPKGYTIS